MLANRFQDLNLAMANILLLKLFSVSLKIVKLQLESE